MGHGYGTGLVHWTAPTITEFEISTISLLINWKKHGWYMYKPSLREHYWVHVYKNFTSCESSTLLDHPNIFLSPFIFTCQLRMQSGCNDCNQCSKLHVDICWHFEFVKRKDRAQRAADSAPPHHSGAHASDQTVYKFKGIIYLFRWMTYPNTIDCVPSFTALPLSDA